MNNEEKETLKTQLLCVTVKCPGHVVQFIMFKHHI